MEFSIQYLLFFRYSRIILFIWPAHCNFHLISYLGWLITFGKFVFFYLGGVIYFKFVLTHQRYEMFSSESPSFLYTCCNYTEYDVKWILKALQFHISFIPVSIEVCEEHYTEKPLLMM